MKIIFILATLISVSLVAKAQPTLTQGAEKAFSFKKQPRFTAVQNSTGAYFIFKSSDVTAPKPTMLALDNSGNVFHVGDIKYDGGVFKNMLDVHSIVSFGDKLLAFMENRDHSGNTNKLSIKTLDNTGNLSSTETVVGSFSYQKILKPGEWYTTVTPDGKHIAVVAELPSEKDELLQFKYFFLDKDLKQISTGNFSFPEVKKRVFMNSFHASDNGNFYMVEDETEKTYHYPKLYKIKTGETTGTVTEIMMEDPKLKMANYVTAIHPNGDLIIAGYSKDKSFMTVGDEQANGMWIYNSTKGKINTTILDKKSLISNARALSILFNGSTTFLVGAKIKDSRETPTQQQAMKFEEDHTYKHSDILVTAFDADWQKKFHLNIAKEYSGRNFDQDLYPAYGIVNGKLAVMYNDAYSKYFDKSSYDNYKVPVLVYITNDGLMEAPVNFAKEFQSTRSSYTLYPQMFASDSGKMIMLAGNGSSVKGVIIK